ncbi:MAG TPA: lysophospholipid acyltransferase family protein [Burkholderiales bacterium]|nr:lysophospholipid acyltransferase family protein [Burkholderiales bacterium]
MLKPSAFAHPRYWPTWLALALLWLLSWLPLAITALLGAGIGTLLYLLHAPRRRIVHTNLERCFPELTRAERRRIACAHFRGVGRAVFDSAIAWWAPAWRLRRLVRLRGREYLERALREKRNLILLAPHFLGLDVGGMRVCMDIPVVSVFRHTNNKLVSWAMQRGRTRMGATLVEHNKPFTTLVRAVKSGQPLYYLPDQDAGRRNAIFAPFFGIPAATFSVLGRLADMTDAVVIPMISIQRPWGLGYEVNFLPPLDKFPTGDALADTTRMNAEIEKAARRWPSQYFWVHKRFKTRPEGEPRFYE